MTFIKVKEDIRIQLSPKQDVDRYVPSVDQMFLSACDVYPGRILGVILTGMGNDGRVGMRRIKEGGGQTIAESEETAVVFGMPKEAIAEGVVDKILPLPQICQEVVRRVLS
jgi:two-component system chemotaxis response regulator CheB